MILLDENEGDTSPVKQFVRSNGFGSSDVGGYDRYSSTATPYELYDTPLNSPTPARTTKNIHTGGGKINTTQL